MTLNCRKRHPPKGCWRGLSLRGSALNEMAYIRHSDGDCCKESELVGLAAKNAFRPLTDRFDHRLYLLRADMQLLVDIAQWESMGASRQPVARLNSAAAF